MIGIRSQFLKQATAAAVAVPLAFASAALPVFVPDAYAAKGFRCDIEIKPALGKKGSYNGRTFGSYYKYHFKQAFGHELNLGNAPREIKQEFSGRVIKSSAQAEKACALAADIIFSNAKNVESKKSKITFGNIGL